jgi:DNA-binding MarR family transcriptional regulator
MQSRSKHYQVIWLVRRLFRAMGQAADEYLKADGITAADRAVMEFLYPDECLSVPAIARRYSVSRQHVQATVNGLLGKSLLEASPNPRHKRSPLIALTDHGRRLFARVREREAGFVDAMFAGIPDADIGATASTLAAMRSNLGSEKTNDQE